MCWILNAVNQLDWANEKWSPVIWGKLQISNPNYKVAVETYTWLSHEASAHLYNENSKARFFIQCLFLLMAKSQMFLEHLLVPVVYGIKTSFCFCSHFWYLATGCSTFLYLFWFFDILQGYPFIFFPFCGINFRLKSMMYFYYSLLKHICREMILFVDQSLQTTHSIAIGYCVL